MTFKKLGTGFSNSNYKVSLDGVQYPVVVRVYGKRNGVATKEQRITEMVRRTVPVAEYLHVDESCSLLDEPYAVLEWREGVLLSEFMGNENRSSQNTTAESAGRTLAEIHKYVFPEFGYFNEKLEIENPVKIDGDLFLSLITSFISNRCGRFLGERTRNDLLTFCKLHGHNLSEDGEYPVLVHSDYNGLNILMKEDTGRASVSAVLDWEYAFSGSKFADIGNMLRYEKEGSDFETHFLQGYESGGGALRDNWRISSKLHDLVALCDLLDRSSDETPKRVQDLIRLIRQTVQN